MKISIWHQFSSNHSATYTIIGEFQDHESAIKAGDKLKQIILEIREWNLRHTTKSDRESGRWKQPNPVEIRYAKEYNFDWKESVDWLRFYPSTKHIRKGAWRDLLLNVIIFDRFVFVTSPPADSTWQVGHQFANLFKAMNAKVHGLNNYGEVPDDDTEMLWGGLLSVVCEAPSLPIAEKVYSELDKHQTSIAPIPWIVFHPHFSRLTNDLPQTEFLDQELLFIHKQKTENYSISDLTDIQEVIEFMRYDVTDKFAVISKSGTTVHLNNIRSFNMDKFISAFAGWARSLNCEVTYTFE